MFLWFFYYISLNVGTTIQHSVKIRMNFVWFQNHINILFLFNFGCIFYYFLCIVFVFCFFLLFVCLFVCLFDFFSSFSFAINFFLSFVFCFLFLFVCLFFVLFLYRLSSVLLLLYTKIKLSKHLIRCRWILDQLIWKIVCFLKFEYGKGVIKSR